MAASSTSRTNPLIEGSKQYPYPSHVNTASFMSVKLFGRGTYEPWQEQMICLLESHDMLGFIDGTLRNPQVNNGCEANSEFTDLEAMCREWKRSDKLVKGWIFGSLNENVMRDVLRLETAKDVWDKLKTNYTPQPASPEPNYTSNEEIDAIIDEKKYVHLCRAIQTGDWVETQKFLEGNPDALTCKLNIDEDRTLHVAVGNPDNIYILNKLLERIHDPKILLTMVDHEQFNALHDAASLDNTAAAKILVEQNPDLLFIPDKFNRLPIERAIINSQENTFRYLFEVCEKYINRIDENTDHQLHNPFEGQHGCFLICETILSGILDVAYKLLEKYPKLATEIVDDRVAPLYCIAKSLEAYPSAKRYNFYQRFVYSHVPVENYKSDNTRLIENQETNMANLYTSN